MNKQINGRPFIIWTLQRTGGTNFARRLIEHSGLLEAAKLKNLSSPSQGVIEKLDVHWQLHEPFNNGKNSRVFGFITDAWLQTGDKLVLASSIRKICDFRLPIKHCVEMVPWEISEELAQESIKAGYAHIFLYRKNSVNRLLSLHFAKLSGIWGPELKGKNELNEKIFADYLPVERLVAHEKKCAQKLNMAWEYLKAQGASPMALAFEDIYQADVPDVPNEKLIPVITLLGLSQSHDADRTFITELIDCGEQGTSNKYKEFKGIDRLELELKKISLFAPDAITFGLKVEFLGADNPLLLHAAIDVFPALIESGKNFEIGGVVVLKEQFSNEGRLQLVSGVVKREIRWGIGSSGMKKRFPQSYNGSNSRFEVGELSLEKNCIFEILLSDTRMRSFPIFRLIFERI